MIEVYNILLVSEGIDVSNVLRLNFQIRAAAALLLESKMFYVPFVLNSAEVR